MISSENLALMDSIMGEGCFHARQRESIANANPNKRYYNVAEDISKRPAQANKPLPFSLLK